MKDGGFLGGRDEKGRLITSADVILEKQAVNVEKFLSFYYSTHN